MSKPPVFAWATSSVYAGGPTPGDPTKVAPLSGQIAEGYYPDDEPEAEVVNHTLARLGLWTGWLDGLFDSSDKLTIPDLEVTDDAEIGGDLTVDGDLLYGPQVIPIGPHSFTSVLDGDEALAQINPGFVEVDSAGSVRAGLTIPVGRRITRITWRCDRAGGVVEGTLVSISEAGAASTIAAVSGTTSNNSTSGTLELDAIYDAPIEADAWYALVFGSSSDGNQLIGARVTHERPA